MTATAPPPLEHANVEIAPAGSMGRPNPAIPPATRTARRTSALKPVAMWLRQLAVLTHSGTPLADALTAVERQAAPGAWKDVQAQVRQRIDEGVALSDALARHPRWFDPVCCSLVAAGESSGKLDAMLSRAATLARQQLRMRRTIVGAMVYPILLVMVAIGVMTTMMGFVFPRFETLFQTLDAPLPPSTQILISISEFLRSSWLPLLVVASVSVVGLVVLSRTAQGQRAIHIIVVRLPIIGHVVRNFVTAAVCRLLGELIESRVPVLESLALTQRSMSNSLYADLLGKATDAVTRGETMSNVFAQSPLIVPSVAEAVRHAERNGQIGPVLTDLADFMDEENETVLRTLTSILEPAILIVLGAIVAVLAMSMFLPLFDLTSMT